MNFSHLRLLAIFATVVEAGSFAAAARKLRSSRSRISEQVAQLEQALTVRLLQRSTRQLTITTEGMQVYDQARRLPALLSEVESIVTPAQAAGRVAITMNHDIAHKHFLPVAAALREQLPLVQLDLIIDDARLDLIAQQIDLAIRIGIPRDESLIARVLHEEAFSLYASPEFLGRYGLPASFEELQSRPWVLLQQLQQRDFQSLRDGDQRVEVAPQTFYRCNSPLMVQQMVAQGFGIGALLPSTVRQELEAGQLIPVLPQLRGDSMVFSLVYPSRQQMPQRTRAVIDFLMAADLFCS